MKVEIAGLAGTNVTGWKIIPYNGLMEQITPIVHYLVLKSIKRLWYIISSYSGTSKRFSWWIALVDASNKVIQFLSYEGAFKATNGPAIGMTSTDIGIAQTSTETVELASINWTRNKIQWFHLDGYS
jgi:hypothetical protein